MDKLKLINLDRSFVTLGYVMLFGSFFYSFGRTIFRYEGYQVSPDIELTLPYFTENFALSFITMIFGFILVVAFRKKHKPEQ